jgi:hypothetical protein
VTRLVDRFYYSNMLWGERRDICILPTKSSPLESYSRGDLGKSPKVSRGRRLVRERAGKRESGRLPGLTVEVTPSECIHELIASVPLNMIAFLTFGSVLLANCFHNFSWVEDSLFWKWL